MRFVACAAVLVAGVLFGGGSGVALADDGDASGSPPDGRAVSSAPVEKPGGSDPGSQGKPGTYRPTSAVGDGRSGTEPKSSNDDGNNMPDPARTRPTTTSRHTWISSRRIPPPAGCELFSTPQPTPQPTPGPAIRTQEEPPPVADSTGGGVPAVANGHMSAPVLRAPLVVAPIPMPVKIPVPRAPVAPTAASPGPGRTQPFVADSVAVGIQPPVIAGSLPPAAGAKPAATPFTPMSGRATRVDYARYVRTPTAGELTAGALPGLAGLLFLTSSGGFIGYRQANSGRFIRTDAARFLR